MAATLAITSNFESSNDAVIAAMLFPSNEANRTAYCLRNDWARRLHSGGSFNLLASDVQSLLDVPSNEELRAAAKTGTKRGTVAGDLLLMMYEEFERKKPEPSMRSALRRYPKWSLGKKYGDGTPLLYSDAQLRRCFLEAEPAAHLWAAFRVLTSASGQRLQFTRDGLLDLLGVARQLQDFATSFIPKRAKPAKPVVNYDRLLLVPAHIEPISFELSPL